MRRLAASRTSVPLLERAADEAQQLLGRIRFRDEMERAELDRFDGVRERVVRGEDDHREIGKIAAQLAQHIEPIGIGQAEIEQDEIGL